jgi:putative membrane protein
VDLTGGGASPVRFGDVCPIMSRLASRAGIPENAPMQAAQTASVHATLLQRGLLLGFCTIWLALGIRPHYRQDWVLENLLVLVAVPLLVHHGRRRPFRDSTYMQLFAFFVLHEIGAHYTYSEVPYVDWVSALTGHEWPLLAETRNHYDRVVHFAYGLLVTPAAIEIFGRYGRYPPVWAWLFPLFFISAHSVIYELVEWVAALAFGGELGQAYLGTQGDIWDAQKDMSLAGLGALLAIAIVAARGQLPLLKR